MELIRANYQSPGKEGKKGFEDLQCFKLALDVMTNAHQVALSLPAEEKYDLTQQLRRASKSIPANIAEGYGRFHFLDALRFYSMVRGSLNETLSHLIVAKTLGYIDQDYFGRFYELVRGTERTLNGLMRYVRDQRRGSDFHAGNTIREGAAGYETDLTDYLEEANPHE